MPFESALFSSPEGRSYNVTVPMPYRKGAKVLLVNESKAHALVWYDLNYTEVKRHPTDVMYFHAAWRREPRTELGKDFEILPRVRGKGRYLGANIGVIGSPDYRGTWFGEGEVKVYLDGDTALPTLVGTGTEDYIGSGWGQGEYRGRIHGSLVSDNTNDLYAFYRYHLDDPVYFHQDCRVTIQQIGNTTTERVREMLAKGVELKPVWVLDTHGGDVLNLTGRRPASTSCWTAPTCRPSTTPSIPRAAATSIAATMSRPRPTSTSTAPRTICRRSPPPKCRLQGLREAVWGKEEIN